MTDRTPPAQPATASAPDTASTSGSSSATGSPAAEAAPRRSTKQREAVREALAASDEFVSAQTLHQALRAGGSSVGLATVYRALAALAEDGEADALQSGSEVLYRACTPTHHHHLICRRCGRTVELEAAAVERWARQVAAEHGFTEPDHVVDIFGLCPECAAA